MKRYIKSNTWEYRKLADYATTCTDPAELRELAESSSSSVRFYVAVNLHTPMDVVLGLLNDPDKSVRDGVILNENIPESIMQEVVDLRPTLRGTYRTKCNLIQNINCPEYILRQLADDADEDVAYLAKRRLNEPGMKSDLKRDAQGVLRHR